MYFLKSVYVSMYEEVSWSDLKDDAGNTLHIGKLEYKTKYGKKADSFCRTFTQGMSSLPFVWFLTFFWSKPRWPIKNATLTISS
jgi:hypothetical protein